MLSVSIGITVHGEPDKLRRTIETLYASTAVPFSILLLPDGPDQETVVAVAQMAAYPQLGTASARGTAACFNRLARNTETDLVVLLESGTIPAAGWLEHILEVFAADPSCGLAGPSTNRAWNEQRAFPKSGPGREEIERTAEEAVRRFGSSLRMLTPLHSLSDFCYVVRREVISAVGGADEEYGLGPCWEMDYNIRAARAGFRGLWICAAYVYRAPPTKRSLAQEIANREASRRRYQDKFCGLRLSGRKNDYRLHCRGDACSNFAPVTTALVQLAPLGCDRGDAAPSALTRPAVPVAQPPPTSAKLMAVAQTLVSCIMPTCDRRRFVPEAIAQFLRQDYPARELIVVDDGRDAVRDLMPADARVRYVRLEKKTTLGEKRNLACREARGEIILHWDDDDWMADHRVGYQVESLKQSEADMCGLDTLIFHDPASARSWQYRCAVRTRPWVAGGTLCYWKSFWRSNPFPPLSVGEDTRFVWSNRSNKVLVLPDHSFYVAIIHDRNTSPKRTSDAQWLPYSNDAVERLFGGRRIAGTKKEVELVSCIMPTRDRAEYVSRAVLYFLRQDYPNKELIVVDDGEVAIAHLLPRDNSIRYLRLCKRHSLGAKRNLAVEHARGQYIVHWDDDDWFAPHRLSAQLRPLRAGQAEVTALAMRTVMELPANVFWRCRPELHARLHHRDLCCGTIAYARPLWQKHGPYPPLNCGEDVRFLAAMGKGLRMERLVEEDLFVCVRHGRNTWRIAPDWTREPRGWERIATPEFIPEEDLGRYLALAEPAGLAIGVACP